MYSDPVPFNRELMAKMWEANFEMHIEILGSVSQYQDFLSSTIYQDFINEIQGWRAHVISCMANTSDLLELGRNQGLLTAMDYMARFFKSTLDELNKEEK